MQSDIAAGKVIKDGKVAQHPDKSGDLYQAGFTHPTFTDDAKKGTTIPYRDDHGKVHPIGVQDMRRTTDPAGNASYSFKVNGKNISVPEDSKAPLFQIDPKDGRRFTTAADGTRRELGYDRKTAAQVGIAPREQARNESREKLLTQGAVLSRQLQDKQAQATAAQQRMDAAKQKYDNPGNATDAERQANYNELMGAFDAHNSLTSEVQTLQKQHDDHYQNIVRDQRARQAEIDQYKAAAAENPEDEQWLKDSRHTRGDTRHTDADLIAEAEKRDPATAAAMRRALTSQPAQRTLAAAQSAFGKNGTAAGRPAAGNTMTLQDMLMHAPEMKQGGWRTVDQADAARATAQSTFGITDPENVHVTPSASGGYSLSRKAGDGSPGQPYATMDGQTGRITLLPGADGRYSQAAQDLAASSTPGSAPIYLGKGTPFTEAERSALIAKGQQAASAAKDRTGADAALTQAGLSPEGIQKLRNEGRLSVQDANFLNNKFNSGVGSYAQRDALNTAQKQNAGLQQMYQDTRAPADQPNFKSWMEKGDPQRDAQVQAKAKELGLSEDNVRQAMEDQRRTDFATPLTQQGADQQSGFFNGLRRGIGFSGHDQDTTRTLTDGSLAVNPALTDDKAKFEKAIQDSNASPEAKAAALKSWPAQHDAWLTRATDTLKASKTLPGVEDYNDWLTKNTLAGHFSQKLPDGSVRQYTDNEKTQLYLDAMKNRSGVRKFMDNVSTSLVAGGGQVVSGLLGAEALVKNSFQDLTGVDVGGQAASEAAADMAQQNQALLQSHDLTGTIEGAGGRLVSNVVQAVPSIGVTVATGGTAGLLVGAAQGAGSTYTDLLQYHIAQGATPEDAHKKAAGTAIASGAVSLALGKIMPGGSQALNNPATREAAQKAFSATVKSAIKGGAEEFSQEAIDGAFNHITSEINKGKTFNEAATSYAEQFPQSALTSALLGGGVQAMADKKNGSAPTPQSTLPQQPAQVAQPAHSQQTSPAQQPAPANPPAPSPQQPIPQPTTQGAEAPGSGKPAPATGGGSPPPSAQGAGSDSAKPPSPPPTPDSTPSGIPQTTTQTEGTGKAADSAPPPQTSTAKPSTPPLSLEQSQKLIANVSKMPAKAQEHPTTQANVAQAKKVVAQETVRSLEQKAQHNGGKLDAAESQALEKAKAEAGHADANAPRASTEAGHADANAPRTNTEPEHADAEAGNDVRDRQPSDSARNTPEPADTNTGKRTSTDTSNTHPSISPDTPPQNQPSGAERSRDGSAGDPSQKSIPDTTTRPDSDPPQPRAAAGNEGRTPTPPDTSGTKDGASPRTTSSGQPAQTSPTAPRGPGEAGSPGQPSSPSPISLPPPRTPPLSPEQSRRLLDNVAKMPEKAQQHPQVQADVAQARQVVTAASGDAFRSGNAPAAQGRSSSQTSQPILSPIPPLSGGGSPSPAQGSSTSPAAASGPVLSPQQHANHARAVLSNLATSLASKFPNLTTPISESAAPNGYGSSMWVNENGSIGYHISTLAKQFAGLDAQTARQRIETLLDAHAQASPENAHPKPVPQLTRALPAPGAKTGAQHLSDIKTKLDAHVKKWSKLAGDIFLAEDEFRKATELDDNKRLSHAQSKLAILDAERQKMVEETRLHIMLPADERGKVRFTNFTPTTKAAASAGSTLAESYLHPSLLPKVGMADFNRDRAAYLQGMLLINQGTNASTVMHEITHGVEEQNPHVLKACQDFLKKRAGNESPQKLRDLTGDTRYEPDEVSYEDDFFSRGGEHYAGKIYPDATEILTMGIERLHKNPVEFYSTDPEYFEFVILTLQQP